MASAFNAITFRFPFYNGDWSKDAVVGNVPLDSSTTIWLTIVSILAGALAFINIFMYANRALQLKLCYLGILISVLLLVLFFLEMQNFSNSVIALWCIFHFGILTFYILATKGVTKDQKLIKSLDRLR